VTSWTHPESLEVEMAFPGRSVDVERENGCISNNKKGGGVTR
jgi:hypothetical protein